MEKGVIDAAATVGLKLAEQNISSIEKMHSKIKMKRYLGQNIVFALGLIISALIASLAIIIPYNFVLNVGLVILIVLCYTLTRDYFKSDQSTISATAVFVVMGSVVGAIGIGQFLDADGSYEYFDIVILSIMGVAFAGYLYILFYYSKLSAEVLTSRIFSFNYKIKIGLINGGYLEGDLITITNKNDYVVREDKKNKETLVKLSSVAFVELE